MTISVLVVEDEPVFLQRFCEAIEGEPALDLCGSARTVAAALALLDRQAPDVLLVDLGLPDGNGIDVIRHAKARHENCDILVVTMFDESRKVVDSIRAGATGYLLKDDSPGNIAAWILHVRAGGAPISPAIARQLLDIFRLSPVDIADAPLPVAEDRPAASLLSSRETEILRLVAKGLNFKEVALLLCISPSTVITHAKRTYQKLAVHSRGEAVYEAIQLGLL
jgi:DNA-binding NarL/FixJ family response regulator